MATYASSNAAPFGAITLFHIMQYFSGKAAAFSQWNEGRITRKVLSRLSDRDLADIGLTRSSIECIGR